MSSQTGKGVAAATQDGFANQMHGMQPANSNDEYDVYIYHPPQADDERGHEFWEKKRTTKNRLRALVAARRLHDTQQYQKVEIQKKSYDAMRCCAVSETVKIYDEQSAARKNAALVFVALGILTVAGAGFYFMI